MTFKVGDEVVILKKCYNLGGDALLGISGMIITIRDYKDETLYTVRTKYNEEDDGYVMRDGEIMPLVGMIKDLYEK